jgi:23S rRNA (cytidine1920-2'-O)/16S rRNA (cytidine1409-2'-O)-methyltransferase
MRPPKQPKLRLDELLVARGLCSTVEEASRRIWAGEVIVEDQMVDHAGERVAAGAHLRLRTRHGRYATRGGDKLERALAALGISADGRTALDVGAAGGGFTDCLLSHGAARVYAVDIGRGQLAQRLRLDGRVVDLGGHDVMTLEPDSLSPRPSLAVVDVTFRSLADVLPKVHSLLTEEQEILALLKPLFEARLSGIGRVQEVQRRVFESLLPRLREAALPVRNVIASPRRGIGGAIEFFLHIRRPGRAREQLWDKVDAALAEAKTLLARKSRPGRSSRKRTPK